MSSKLEDENVYLKNIINCHAKTIIELQNELNTYKRFYESIVENNVINDKFEEYNNIITSLQNENNDLKQKLK
jgi:3-methyladenine DNA glycosylase Tag